MRKPLALIAALAVSALTASSASAASPDAPWSAAGTGTTTATSDGTSSDPVLNYSVAGNTGSWKFNATAKTAHQQQLNWHYTGYNAWFQVRVGIEKFVIRAGKEVLTQSLAAAGPVNCCAAPSGGFDYSGSTTFDLQAGDVYGFRMTGSNADSDRRLLGTLTLTLPQAAPTATPIPRPTGTPIPTSNSDVDAVVALQSHIAALDSQVKAAADAMAAQNAQIQQLVAARVAALAAGDTAKAAQLQTQIDALTAQAQRDQVSSQALINQRNDAFMLMSNLLSKLSAAQQQIINNIR